VASDLSVASIAALGAAGALLIGAFFAGIVSVITAWRTIAQKITAIEGHVNSEKTASEGRENTLKRENEILREMLSERKQTAALLAQAASHPTTPIVRPARAEDNVLAKIETNTAETADGVRGLKTQG
jgi:hypothetical protein